jgi:[acyl-carrier-protein] S-malonyltransferase
MSALGVNIDAGAGAMRSNVGGCETGSDVGPPPTRPDVSATGTLTAVVFPGQGSPCSQMEEHVRNRCPDLLEALEEAVGEAPFARLREGTAILQPALYCASVAGWMTLCDAGVRPDVAAGHSVGELAALVAAGSVSAHDGLELVVARGWAMQQAGGHNRGGMLALLGADHETAAELARSWGLHVANLNSPQQVVLAGDRDLFATAREEAKQLGYRAVVLPVDGAFHSPAMASAVGAFEAVLGATEFAAPSLPVYSGATGRPFRDLRRELAAGLTCAVRWQQVVQALYGRGTRRFIEAGPGDVLTKLISRTLSGVEAVDLEGATGALV